MKTWFDIITDVLLAVLIPLSIYGIWFLVNVRSW